MSQCQASSFHAGGGVTLHCGDVTDDVKNRIVIDNNIGDVGSTAAAAAEPNTNGESPATVVVTGGGGGAACSSNPVPEIRIAPAADPSEGPSGSAKSASLPPATSTVSFGSASARGRTSGSACGTSKISVSSLFPHHPVAPPPPPQQRQSARWRSERRLSVPIGKPLCPRCVDEPYIFSLAQAVDALKSSGGTAASATRRLSDPGRGVGVGKSRSAGEVTSDDQDAAATSAAAAADVAGLAGRRLVFVGKQSAPSSSTSAAARIAKTKDVASKADPDATAAVNSKPLPLPSVDELTKLMQFDVVAPSADVIDAGAASIGTIQQGNETAGASATTSTATGSDQLSSSVRSSRFLSLPASVMAAAALGAGTGRALQQRGGSQPRRHSVALMTGSTSRQLEAIAEEATGCRSAAAASAASAAVACGGLTADHGQSLRRYSLTVPSVTSSGDDMMTFSDDE